MLIKEDNPEKVNQLLHTHSSVIIHFSAPWCGASAEEAVELGKIEKKFGDLVVLIEMNSDLMENDEELVPEYGEFLPFSRNVHELEGLPVLVFIKDGALLPGMLGEDEEEPGMTLGLIRYKDIKTILENHNMV
ncbi:MAG: thioredoxin family protein [Promethearchaeota archaeon]